MTSLHVLILAAGKGVRMRSARPKVLHPIGDIPMVGRVLATVQLLQPTSSAMVVGHGSRNVQDTARRYDPRIKFFHQNVQNGSGGAVRCATSWLKKLKGDVLVTCGDTPLLTGATLKNLVAGHRRGKNAATILTTEIDVPFGYGRIARGFDGRVTRIVEELDATEEERKIREINTGTYCFQARALVAALPRLQANNRKRELYLTDVVEIIHQGGGRVGGVMSDDFSETLGINSRSDLAKAASVLNQRVLLRHMANGVTIMDPASTYIDETVRIGSDTVIWPQTFLRGQTRISSGCQIGPWAYVSDCVIQNDVIFRASFAESGTIKTSARVGPYSRIRPGSVIGPRVHLGNFSEVKNTRLGEGTKVNHLSYLGDATLGKNVNIGAGTITCNYDGINKFPTFIQDNAFIGSNVNLIAPVTVGAHAVVGAGSSIDRNVPAWALALERGRQVEKKGWAKKKFKKGT